MTVHTNTPEFLNDICDVIRIFYPDASFDDSGDILTHSVAGSSQIVRFRDITVKRETPTLTGDNLYDKRHLKRAIKTACYDVLKRVTNIYSPPPWGSLTGIRPTRLLYEFMSEGMAQLDATRRLVDLFDVQPDKARLLSEIIDAQRRYMHPAIDAYDVYVGIPFCPTRCAYCSFASQGIGDTLLTEAYLDALDGEMRLLAPVIAEMKLTPRAIYVGGGTPTSLSIVELKRVLNGVRDCFGDAPELTVEAGRPDSVNRDMLKMLKDNGVTRISINPQTMHDVTLTRIGRNHSARQTVSAFDLAQSVGFDAINMDLIAALPGETPDMFVKTVREVASMRPTDVTVHTLAIKRASRLNQEEYANAPAQIAQEMVNFARNALHDAGYAPYYLYRQKYMAGNLENVGYTRAQPCVYNIDIMEEIAPILAFGAGSITKWLFNAKLRIERAPNVKNIDHYIARYTEMARRKIDLITAPKNR